MSNQQNYADAFNLALFGGERVVDPATLRPLDTNLYMDIFGAETPNKSSTVQRFRDVSQVSSVVMQGDGMTYILMDMEYIQ